MSTKAEHATKLHENGCNCAQAVACSFCREFGIDENEMFRIAEGFGLGKLAAGVFAREDVARFLRHRAGGFTAVAFDDGAGLVAGVSAERTGEDEGESGEAIVLALLLAGEIDSGFAQELYLML